MAKKIFTDESLSTLVSEIKTYTDNAVSGKANTNHAHDDRYYTESEIDSKINTINSSIAGLEPLIGYTANTTPLEVANAVMSGRPVIIVHEDAIFGMLAANNFVLSEQTMTIMASSIVYYNGNYVAYELYGDIGNGGWNSKFTTVAEQESVTEALSGKADSNHNHDDKYDAKNSATTAAANALAEAKSYTDTKTSGMVTTTVVDNKVSTHNTSTDAHNDIRNLITGLTNRLNALADSDDATLDQMSEIVAYIKANKALIESVTTSKVSVSDIVNNLTTNVTNQPLSAAQGVAIKGLIDTLQGEVDTHEVDTTKHVSSTERTNWEAAYAHSQQKHAPNDAEKNQNAFSNIKVGSTTVAADTTTDTVTFEGSNVTITPDATNDKITFTVADGSTSAKGVVQLTNSTSSTSTTTAATPNSVKSAYDLADTAKTRADEAYELASDKDSVSFTQTLTSGNAIGTININGTGTTLYAHTTGITAGASSTTSNSAADNPYIKIKDNSSHRGQIRLKGDGATTVKSDANGNITISSTDTDTKVKMMSTATNGNFPLLLAPTDVASTDYRYSYYDGGIYANPSLNRIYADISGTATGLKDMTTTVAELNYMMGATSNIQTQLNAKANASALSSYYTKNEIDNMELITIDDIDTICSATIQVATLSNEVKF